MADSFVSRFGCYTIIRDTTLQLGENEGPRPVPADQDSRAETAT